MTKFFNSFSVLRALFPRNVVYLILSLLSIFIAPHVCANQQLSKAEWYRYYDKNGVANISSSVTPEHIRRGYEALDRNMQVIKKNHAYNVQEDLKKAPIRAIEAREKDEDLKVKKAYGSSQIAIKKRDDSLKNINKQFALQNVQLKQAEQDRIVLKKQEMGYLRQNKPVPTDLKERLSYNIVNINNIKNNIQSLRLEYQSTQSDYDKIIKRLKAIE